MRIPSEHKIPGRFAPIFLWKKEDNYVKIKNKELYMCNICARCSKTMLVFWEILLSLSARRVWIEIRHCAHDRDDADRHSPRGGCGLKSTSLPVENNFEGHSPRGGCGLKSSIHDHSIAPFRHSPRGGCGLKSLSAVSFLLSFPSLSARRVWIEI